MKQSFLKAGRVLGSHRRRHCPQCLHPPVCPKLRGRCQSRKLHFQRCQFRTDGQRFVVKSPNVQGQQSSVQRKRNKFDKCFRLPNFVQTAVGQYLSLVRHCRMQKTQEWRHFLSHFSHNVVCSSIESLENFGAAFFSKIMRFQKTRFFERAIFANIAFTVRPQPGSRSCSAFHLGSKAEVASAGCEPPLMSQKLRALVAPVLS
jgi:hypothetical protein